MARLVPRPSNASRTPDGRHIASDHDFERLITLREAGDGRTAVRWRQRIATAEHCREVAEFLRGANEQNLEHWAAVVAESA